VWKVFRYILCSALDSFAVGFEVQDKGGDLDAVAPSGTEVLALSCKPEIQKDSRSSEMACGNSPGESFSRSRDISEIWDLMMRSLVLR